jgi:hypothetical protein
VRLTQNKTQTAVTAATRASAPSGSPISSADIYRVYFHGPAYQVLDRAWRDGERIVGQMTEGLPTHHYPPEQPMLMAPRLIELCFQTAGLWEMSVQDRFGLPLHVDRVRVCRASEFAEGRLCAVVTPHPEQESFDAEILDAKGNCYLQVTGYRTVALPGAVDAEPLKALHAVMA